jgi:maltooligosyltrehalose trehalohydrolase
MAALTSEQALHAGLSLLLLAPQIPLLYMGEEWGSKTPFLFFCNLGEDLAPLVTKGRREEFAKFEQFSDPEVRERIPDPSAEQTFNASRLNWDELKQAEHQRTKNLTAQLLKLRSQKIVPLCAAFETGVSAKSECLSERAFIIEWNAADGRKLICLANLSNESLAYDMSRFKSAQQLFAVGETKSDGVSPWTVVWWTE